MKDRKKDTRTRKIYAIKTEYYTYTSDLSGEFCSGIPNKMFMKVVKNIGELLCRLMGGSFLAIWRNDWVRISGDSNEEMCACMYAFHTRAIHIRKIERERHVPECVSHCAVCCLQFSGLSSRLFRIVVIESKRSAFQSRAEQKLRAL